MATGGWLWGAGINQDTSSNVFSLGSFSCQISSLYLHILVSRNRRELEGLREEAAARRREGWDSKEREQQRARGQGEGKSSGAGAGPLCEACTAVTGE